ncbi:hypothetical protein [Paraburkholderia elongata]|uniref:Uncharacterized protein n=1 Tax=Paraburkholderia elongata TaxID=2675747 RepID=A0A972NPF0_9BURK|nr:hypothetical protein [Paraburkholderia elongata]NPT55984.1 hypothetical protein [Paraburkholderia elongata]
MKNETEVPDDFPPDDMPAVVSGVQTKIGAVLSRGRYIVGQTDEEREVRWMICEDLAQRLIAVARKDAAKHPTNITERTVERVRVSVARKNWVSADELTWLMRRPGVLLAQRKASGG